MHGSRNKFVLEKLNCFLIWIGPWKGSKNRQKKSHGMGVLLALHLWTETIVMADGSCRCWFVQENATPHIDLWSHPREPNEIESGAGLTLFRWDDEQVPRRSRRAPRKGLAEEGGVYLHPSNDPSLLLGLLLVLLHVGIISSFLGASVRSIVFSLVK
jgi:hypothetical protein